MIIDDPKFVRGSWVVVIGGAYKGSGGTVTKAIKGRNYARILLDNHNVSKHIYKELLKVVTMEADPELFI